MTRWERFWWAKARTSSKGFWKSLRIALRFAREPGKVHTVTRQQKREFDRQYGI